MSRSTPKDRVRARRALLVWFAMFERDRRIAQGADLVAGVVRKQEGSEFLAADAAARETTRILEVEEKRRLELLAASDPDLLAAAQRNMLDFNPFQASSAVATSAKLAAIDTTIQSPNTPHLYFPEFSEFPLFKQSYVLERLIAASVDNTEIHGFTGHVFDILRNSTAYEPSVHGKLQQRFQRVRSPRQRKGRPTTAGNALLAELIQIAIQDFNLPKSTAAKIVQETVSSVLGVVREGESVVRRPFSPTNAAIKKIVEKL